MLLVSGCSGINGASIGVSPATFLLPGLIPGLVQDDSSTNRVDGIPTPTRMIASKN